MIQIYGAFLYLSSVFYNYFYYFCNFNISQVIIHATIQQMRVMPLCCHHGSMAEQLANDVDWHPVLVQERHCERIAGMVAT